MALLLSLWLPLLSFAIGTLVPTHHLLRTNNSSPLPDNAPHDQTYDDRTTSCGVRACRRMIDERNHKRIGLFTWALNSESVHQMPFQHCYTSFTTDHCTEYTSLRSLEARDTAPCQPRSIDDPQFNQWNGTQSYHYGLSIENKIPLFMMIIFSFTTIWLFFKSLEKRKTIAPSPIISRSFMDSNTILIVLITLYFRTNSAFMSLSSFARHTCVMQGNSPGYGSLFCWGKNQYGQCGYESSAVYIGGASNEMGPSLPNIDTGIPIDDIVEVATGTDHSCILTNDGKVKCFGDNHVGQLGIGNTIQMGTASNTMGSDLPFVDLGTNMQAISIAVGSYHTCAIVNNGPPPNMVKCFGDNHAGQLGQGDTNDRGDVPGEMGDNLPAIDLGSTTFDEPVQISAGVDNTCVLSVSGEIKCFGHNWNGNLGIGTTTDRYPRGDEPGEMGDALPTVDLGTFTPVQIDVGANHACAREETGAVKCWGENNLGQLGYEDTNHRGNDTAHMGDALLIVDLGGPATQISTGWYHSCAVFFGDIKCWGYGGDGALGYENTNSLGYSTGQMGVALPTVNLGTAYNGQVANVHTAGSHTCATFLSDEVKCWGGNSAAQLGSGNHNTFGDAPGTMGNNLPIVSLNFGQLAPTFAPSSNPSKTPLASPSDAPSSASSNPSKTPSSSPSMFPSSNPSKTPSFSPSDSPSSNPSKTPSSSPSMFPSSNPSETPSSSPVTSPTYTRCGFIGNPCVVSGDPHFTLWNGNAHSFQGQPETSKEQFYYIHPCYGSNNTDMPFNVLGTHVKLDPRSLTGLDYIMLELFEENDTYYVWLSSSIHGWVLDNGTWSTSYENNTASTPTDLVSGQATPIGTRFEVTYTQTTAAQIDVTLLVDGTCPLTLRMVGHAYFADGRYKMHHLVIAPTDCYKCVTCGLCGDFKRATRNETDYERLETCDGKYVSYGSGWDEDTVEAYDLYGMGWERSYVQDHCQGVTAGTVPYEPYIPPSFNFIDACDATLEAEIATACQNAYNNMASCCNTVGSALCDKQLTICEHDTCAWAAGNVSRIPAGVDHAFTKPITTSCDFAQNTTLFHPDNLVIPPELVAVTHKPTPSPVSDSSFLPLLVFPVSIYGVKPPKFFAPLDVGYKAFNEYFHKAAVPIIRRECPQCNSTHQVIYYKKVATDDSFDAYETMYSWENPSVYDEYMGKDTSLHKVFNLYSSLSDALNDENAWTYCNYCDGTEKDKYGNKHACGSFYECGPTGNVPDQWCSPTYEKHIDWHNSQSTTVARTRECRFSIYGPTQSPTTASPSRSPTTAAPTFIFGDMVIDSLFIIPNATGNFTFAKDYCTTNYHAIANIYDPEENKQLLRYIEKHLEGKDSFIGYYQDQGVIDWEWKWVSGFATDPLLWLDTPLAQITANKHLPNTNCMTMSRYGWQYSECNRTDTYFVCETKAHEPQFKTSSSGAFAVNTDRKLTFDDARSLCRSMYKDLATIYEEEEYATVQSMCHSTNCWIGYRRGILNENEWKWMQDIPSSVIPINLLIDVDRWSLTPWQESAVTATCQAIDNVVISYAADGDTFTNNQSWAWSYTDEDGVLVYDADNVVYDSKLRLKVNVKKHQIPGLICKIAFEDDIYTTAAAPSSYKYWKVMEDDDDIVVTNNTALVFDPLLVIPGGTTATTNYTAIDVGEDAFNTRFRASYEYIIRRECANCDATHKEIYYKRLTKTDTFDVYKSMAYWTDNFNKMGTDFNLYSTLDDALNDVNAWSFCNYNHDKALISGTGGSFRDCGPTTKASGQECGIRTEQQCRYSVCSKTTEPTSISSAGAEWIWNAKHKDISSVADGSVTFDFSFENVQNIQNKPGDDCAAVSYFAPHKWKTNHCEEQLYPICNAIDHQPEFKVSADEKFALLTDRTLTRTDAATLCNNIYGLGLATIYSYAEYQDIAAMVTEYSIANAWIGLRYDHSFYATNNLDYNYGWDGEDEFIFDDWTQHVWSGDAFSDPPTNGDCVQQTSASWVSSDCNVTKSYAVCNYESHKPSFSTSQLGSFYLLENQLQNYQNGLQMCRDYVNLRSTGAIIYHPIENERAIWLCSNASAVNGKGCFVGYNNMESPVASVVSGRCEVPSNAHWHVLVSYAVDGTSFAAIETTRGDGALHFSLPGATLQTKVRFRVTNVMDATNHAPYLECSIVSDGTTYGTTAADVSQWSARFPDHTVPTIATNYEGLANHYWVTGWDVANLIDWVRFEFSFSNVAISPPSNDFVWANGAQVDVFSHPWWQSPWLNNITTHTLDGYSAIVDKYCAAIVPDGNGDFGWDLVKCDEELNILCDSGEDHAQCWMLQSCSECAVRSDCGWCGDECQLLDEICHASDTLIEQEFGCEDYDPIMNLTYKQNQEYEFAVNITMCSQTAPQSIETEDLYKYVNYSHCVYQQEQITLSITSDWEAASYGNYEILGKVDTVTQFIHGQFHNTTSFAAQPPCDIRIEEGYVKNVTCQKSGAGHQNNMTQFDMLQDVLRYLMPRLEKRLFATADIGEDNLFGYTTIDRNYYHHSDDHSIHQRVNKKSISAERYANSTTDLLWQHLHTVEADNTVVKHMNFVLIHVFAQIPYHDESSEKKIFTWVNYDIDLVSETQITTQQIDALRQSLSDLASDDIYSKSYTLEEWRGIRPGDYMIDFKTEEEKANKERRRLGGIEKIKSFCEKYDKWTALGGERVFDFWKMDLWASQLVGAAKQDIKVTDLLKSIASDGYDGKLPLVKESPFPIIPGILEIDLGFQIAFGLGFDWVAKENPTPAPILNPHSWDDCPLPFKIEKALFPKIVRAMKKVGKRSAKLRKEAKLMTLSKETKEKIWVCCVEYREVQRDCSKTNSQAQEAGNTCMRKAGVTKFLAAQVNYRMPLYSWQPYFVPPSVLDLISFIIAEVDAYDHADTLTKQFGAAYANYVVNGSVLGDSDLKSGLQQTALSLKAILDVISVFSEAGYIKHKRYGCKIDTSVPAHMPLSLFFDVEFNFGPIIGTRGLHQVCSLFRSTHPDSDEEDEDEKRRRLGMLYAEYPIIPEIELPCIPISPPLLMLCPEIIIASRFGIDIEPDIGLDKLGMELAPLVGFDIEASMSLTIGIVILNAEITMGVRVYVILLEFPFDLGMHFDPFGVYGSVGIDFKVLDLNVFLEFKLCAGIWIFKVCFSVTLFDIEFTMYEYKKTFAEFGMGSYSHKSAIPPKPEDAVTQLRFYWAFYDELNGEFYYDWKQEDFDDAGFNDFDVWSDHILHTSGCSLAASGSSVTTQFYSNLTGSATANVRNITDPFECQYNLDGFDKALVADITIKWNSLLEMRMCYHAFAAQMFDESLCCALGVETHDTIQKKTGMKFDISSYKMIILDVNGKWYPDTCVQFFLNVKVQIDHAPYYDDCSNEGWKIAADITDPYSFGNHDILGQHSLVTYDKQPTCLNWFDSNLAVKATRNFEITFGYDILMIGLRFWAKPASIDRTDHWYGLRFLGESNYYWMSNVNSSCYSAEEGYVDWRHVRDDTISDLTDAGAYCYTDVLVYIDAFHELDHYQFDLEIMANVAPGEAWGFSGLIMNTFTNEDICVKGIDPIIEVETQSLPYTYYGVRDIPSIYYGYVLFDISFDYRFHDISSLISLSFNGLNDDVSEHFVVHFDHQQSGMWIRSGTGEVPVDGILTLDPDLSSTVVDTDSNDDRVYTEMYIQWDASSLHNFIRIGWGHVFGERIIATMEYDKFKIGSDKPIQYIGFARGLGSTLPGVYTYWKVYSGNLPSYCFVSAEEDIIHESRNYAQTCVAHQKGSAGSSHLVVYDLVTPNCVYYTDDTTNVLQWAFSINNAHNYVTMSAGVFGTFPHNKTSPTVTCELPSDQTWDLKVWYAVDGISFKATGSYLGLSQTTVTFTLDDVIRKSKVRFVVEHGLLGGNTAGYFQCSILVNGVTVGTTAVDIDHWSIQDHIWFPGSPPADEDLYGRNITTDFGGNPNHYWWGTTTTHRVVAKITFEFAFSTMLGQLDINIDGQVTSNIDAIVPYWQPNVNTGACNDIDYFDGLTQHFSTDCHSTVEATFEHVSTTTPFKIEVSAGGTGVVDFGVSHITLLYGTCNDVLPLVRKDIRYDHSAYTDISDTTLHSISSGYVVGMVKSQLDEYVSAESYVYIGVTNTSDPRWIVRFAANTIEVWTSTGSNGLFGATKRGSATLTQSNIINNDDWFRFYISWDRDADYFRVGSELIVNESPLIDLKFTVLYATKGVYIDSIGVMHANNQSEADWNVISFVFIPTSEPKLCFTTALESTGTTSWINTDMNTIWLTENDEPTVRIPTTLTSSLIFNGPFLSGEYITKTLVSVYEHDYIMIQARLYGFGEWDVLYPSLLNGLSVYFNNNDDDKTLIWFDTYLVNGGSTDMKCNISDYKQWSSWTELESTGKIPVDILTSDAPCYYDLNIYLKHNATNEPFTISFNGDLEDTLHASETYIYEEGSVSICAGYNGIDKYHYFYLENANELAVSHFHGKTLYSHSCDFSLVLDTSSVFVLTNLRTRNVVQQILWSEFTDAFRSNTTYPVRVILDGPVVSVVDDTLENYKVFQSQCAAASHHPGEIKMDGSVAQSTKDFIAPEVFTFQFSLDIPVDSSACDLANWQTELFKFGTDMAIGFATSKLFIALRDGSHVVKHWLTNSDISHLAAAGETMYTFKFDAPQQKVFVWAKGQKNGYEVLDNITASYVNQTTFEINPYGSQGCLMIVSQICLSDGSFDSIKDNSANFDYDMRCWSGKYKNINRRDDFVASFVSDAGCGSVVSSCDVRFGESLDYVPYYDQMSSTKIPNDLDCYVGKFANPSAPRVHNDLCVTFKKCESPNQSLYTKSWAFSNVNVTTATCDSTTPNITRKLRVQYDDAFETDDGTDTLTADDVYTINNGFVIFRLQPVRYPNEGFGNRSIYISLMNSNKVHGQAEANITWTFELNNEFGVKFYRGNRTGTQRLIGSQYIENILSPTDANYVVGYCFGDHLQNNVNITYASDGQTFEHVNASQNNDGIYSFTLLHVSYASKIHFAVENGASTMDTASALICSIHVRGEVYSTSSDEAFWSIYKAKIGGHSIVERDQYINANSTVPIVDSTDIADDAKWIWNFECDQSVISTCSDERITFEFSFMNVDNADNEPSFYVQWDATFGDYIRFGFYNKSLHGIGYTDNSDLIFETGYISNLHSHVIYSGGSFGKKSKIYVDQIQLSIANDSYNLDTSWWVLVNILNTTAPAACYGYDLMKDQQTRITQHVWADDGRAMNWKSNGNASPDWHKIQYLNLTDNSTSNRYSSPYYFHFPFTSTQDQWRRSFSIDEDITYDYASIEFDIFTFCGWSHETDSVAVSLAFEEYLDFAEFWNSTHTKYECEGYHSPSWDKVIDVVRMNNATHQDLSCYAKGMSDPFYACNLQLVTNERNKVEDNVKTVIQCEAFGATSLITLRYYADGTTGDSSPAPPFNSGSYTYHNATSKSRFTLHVANNDLSTNAIGGLKCNVSVANKTFIHTNASSNYWSIIDSSNSNSDIDLRNASDRFTDNNDETAQWIWNGESGASYVQFQFDFYDIFASHYNLSYVNHHRANISNVTNVTRITFEATPITRCRLTFNSNGQNISNFTIEDGDSISSISSTELQQYLGLKPVDYIYVDLEDFEYVCRLEIYSECAFGGTQSKLNADATGTHALAMIGNASSWRMFAARGKQCMIRFGTNNITMEAEDGGMVYDECNAHSTQSVHFTVMDAHYGCSSHISFEVPNTNAQPFVLQVSAQIDDISASIKSWGFGNLSITPLRCANFSNIVPLFAPIAITDSASSVELSADDLFSFEHKYLFMLINYFKDDSTAFVLTVVFGDSWRLSLTESQCLLHNIQISTSVDCSSNAHFGALISKLIDSSQPQLVWFEWDPYGTYSTDNTKQFRFGVGDSFEDGLIVSEDIYGDSSKHYALDYITFSPEYTNATTGYCSTRWGYVEVQYAVDGTSFTTASTTGTFAALLTIESKLRFIVHRSNSSGNGADSYLECNIFSPITEQGVDVEDAVHGGVTTYTTTRAYMGFFAVVAAPGYSVEPDSYDDSYGGKANHYWNSAWTHYTSVTFEFTLAGNLGTGHTQTVRRPNTNISIAVVQLDAPKICLSQGVDQLNSGINLGNLWTDDCNKAGWEWTQYGHIVNDTITIDNQSHSNECSVTQLSSTDSNCFYGPFKGSEALDYGDYASRYFYIFGDAVEHDVISVDLDYHSLCTWNPERFENDTAYVFINNAAIWKSAPQYEFVAEYCQGYALYDSWSLDLDYFDILNPDLISCLHVLDQICTFPVSFRFRYSANEISNYFRIGLGAQLNQPMENEAFAFSNVRVAYESCPQLERMSIGNLLYRINQSTVLSEGDMLLSSSANASAYYLVVDANCTFKFVGGYIMWSEQSSDCTVGGLSLITKTNDYLDVSSDGLLALRNATHVKRSLRTSCESSDGFYRYSMNVSDALTAGWSMYSLDCDWKLTVQENGGVEVALNDVLKWSYGRDVYQFAFNSDGFVAVNEVDSGSSDILSLYPADFMVFDDAKLILIDHATSSAVQVFDFDFAECDASITTSANAHIVMKYFYLMKPGDVLWNGEALVSSNCDYKLVLSDGKLQILNASNAAVWTANPSTNAGKFEFLRDGRMVLYSFDADNTVIWTTGTSTLFARHSIIYPDRAILNDDGQFFIVDNASLTVHYSIHSAKTSTQLQTEMQSLYDEAMSCGSDKYDYVNKEYGFYASWISYYNCDDNLYEKGVTTECAAIKYCPVVKHYENVFLTEESYCNQYETDEWRSFTSDYLLFQMSIDNTDKADDPKLYLVLSSTDGLVFGDEFAANVLSYRTLLITIDVKTNSLTLTTKHANETLVFDSALFDAQTEWFWIEWNVNFNYISIGNSEFISSQSAVFTTEYSTFFDDQLSPNEHLFSAFNLAWNSASSPSCSGVIVVQLPPMDIDIAKACFEEESTSYSPPANTVMYVAPPTTPPSMSPTVVPSKSPSEGPSVSPTTTTVIAEETQTVAPSTSPSADGEADATTRCNAFWLIYLLMTSFVCVCLY